MKKTLYLAYALACLSGCRCIDWELWSLNDVKPFSEMKSAIKPRMNGYYELNQLQRNRDDLSFNYVFMIFEDGSYASSYPFRLLHDKPEEIRNGNWMHWGRFVIEGEDIRIQHFDDTSYKGRFLGGFVVLSVNDSRGKILNDSTIMITSTIFKNQNQHYGFDAGIHDITYNPPLIFHFEKYDSMPSSDNWLKDKLKKKK